MLLPRIGTFVDYRWFDRILDCEYTVPALVVMSDATRPRKLGAGARNYDHSTAVGESGGPSLPGGKRLCLYVFTPSGVEIVHQAAHDPFLNKTGTWRLQTLPSFASGGALSS